MNKQVKVVNRTGEVLEVVRVRNVHICFCGKEMFILQDGHDRMWKCTCMSEWIHKCTRCKDWVYEDMCYPEDFDDTLGITFYYGHPHCMMKLPQLTSSFPFECTPLHLKGIEWLIQRLKYRPSTFSFLCR